jgi:FixJ family two-component response regulator
MREGESRVLIVDDDGDLRESLAELVEMALGQRILSAASLDDVVALGDRALRCGLIIIDVNLGSGRPDGLSVLSWLRAHDFAGDVVFLTGHAILSHDVQLAHGSEGVPVLSKPVEADALLSLVESRL